MVSGAAKQIKCKKKKKSLFCENDMLRSGNLGLKMGVSRVAHTQYAIYGSAPPPPPPKGIFHATNLHGVGSSSRSLAAWRNSSAPWRLETRSWKALLLARILQYFSSPGFRHTLSIYLHRWEGGYRIIQHCYTTIQF